MLPTITVLFNFSLCFITFKLVKWRLLFSMYLKFSVSVDCKNACFLLLRDLLYNFISQASVEALTFSVGG